MTRLEAVKVLLTTVREIRTKADTETAAEVLPVELRLARREKALLRGVRPGRKSAKDAAVRVPA